MKKIFVATAYLLIAIGSTTTVLCQNNPVMVSGFHSEYVQTFDYTIPIGLTFNSTGTEMFVWEKRGRVYLSSWNGSSYVRQTTPVLDISDEVGDWKDMGFTGFLLDPNYENNNLIYCYYVVDQHHLLYAGTPQYNPAANAYFAATITRITRYKTTVNGSGDVVIIPSSRKILFGESPSTGSPVLYDSHGACTMRFGSDGTLLVSTGEGASYTGTDAGGTIDPHTGFSNGSYAPEALSLGIIRPNEDVGTFRSQMLNSFNGKILRLDPETGDGIPSNPYFDPSDSRSAKSRVWALGLRNPFRFSIKPNTGSVFPTSGDPGALYISDVGFGEWEKLVICDKPGENFGWPIWEGIDYQDNYKNLGTLNKDEPNPLFGSGGCTEEFFRFIDLIKEATPDGNTDLPNPCNPGQNIDPGGDPKRFVHKLPVMDWYHTNGLSTRVPVFVGNNVTMPEIGTPASGVAGNPFNGFASIGGTFYVGDKYPPEYNNSFFLTDYSEKVKNLVFIYDNTLSEVKPFADKPIVAFNMEVNPLDGLIYYVSHRDPNTSGQTGRVRKFVFGGNLPPFAKITITNNGGKNYGPSDLDLDLSSDGSFDPTPGGTISYEWDFGDGSPVSTEANPSHTFSNAGIAGYTVTLTVTDNEGETATATIVVSVNNTPPTVAITNPVNNSRYTTGAHTDYTLTADVADAESPLGDLNFSWQPILRHNTHEHPSSPLTIQTPETGVSGEGCGGETFYYVMQLTVTDPQGLSTFAESKIFPDCLALPVTLLSFSASERQRLVNLNWKTTNESKILMYEIERSKDGRTFEKIGEVGPHDLTSGTLIKDYDFLDNSPLPGKAYYRLKILNVDGRFEYSIIISISLKDIPPQGIKVYPTPFVNDIAIETYFMKPGEVTIQLIDVSGRILKTRKQMVTESTRILTMGGLQDILPGSYYINLIYDGEVRKAKVMKLKNQ